MTIWMLMLSVLWMLLAVCAYRLGIADGLSAARRGRLTGGRTENKDELLRRIDVLIDGPFLLSQRTLEAAFRGSRNQRILDVPASLAAGHAVPITKGRWLGEY